MPRRRQSDQIAFGSDSFLDIVANIVGILIILIVIAGVRVSQMPALLPITADDEPVAIPPVLAVASPEPELHVAEATPQLSPPPLPEPTPPPEPISPPPELLQRRAALDDRLARLQQIRTALEAKLSRQAAELDSLKGQVAASQSARDSEQEQIESGRRTVAALQTDLETNQREIAGLQLELAELEATRPPARQLRHKVTAIGKVVNGQELFFLLSGNKIAVVPLKELGEKLQEQLQRKKSQLLRGRIRVGTVGPVRGFEMKYAVQREAVSLQEELQLGTTIVKLGISEWRILPQADVRYETAQEALQPRSRFLETLRSAGADATLTYWVYPDSFAIHRQLRDFAYDNGFDVASRPLPEGIPIAGSPRGSRSVAQ